MTGSAFAYGGLVVFLAGLALIARPASRTLIRTRRRAIVLAGAGIALGVGSLAAPAFTTRVSPPASRLDEIAPAWQFREYHVRHVAAAPDRVFAALREVRADEIALFNTLTWIRRFGRPLPPGILNARREPIIDVALKGGFVTLAEDPPRELVVGTIVVAPPGRRPALTRQWLASPPPGFAVGTMNFLVKPDGAGGTWVSTETRVFATSPSARRAFAAYWRVIYPGSALIRRMWLRAIERRAVRT